MSQALYRKWRPHLWEGVIGQEHIIHTLQNAVRSERVGHAYLFAGPRGTGKTSTARLLAKAVNCLNPDLNNRPCDECSHCIAVNEGRFLDLIEIDAASNTSVDDIRSLRDKINFAPTEGKYKVYIIDEVHMLSTAAFNALLKTLEEPPDHAIFILATTEIHKIPPTVLSRCQRHEFRRIPVREIVDHLRNLADSEKIDIDEDALILISRQATGSMRDAISLLDQLSAAGEKITLATAQTVLGTATNQLVIELINNIQARDSAQGLTCIHQALDSGTDARQFARQIVEYLRGLLLIQLGNGDQVDATSEMKAQMEKHAERLNLPQLLNITHLFNSAASDLRSAWQPNLPLELALAESIEVLDPHPVLVPQTVQTAVVQNSQPTVPQTTPKTALPQTPKAQPTANIVEEPAQKAVETTKPPVQPESSGIPEETPIEVSTSAPTVTLQQVKNKWREIRHLVRDYSKPAAALLNSCQLMSIKDGMLSLGFANEVLRSKMDTKENLNLASQAIKHILGAELAIQCIASSSGTSGAPDNVHVEEGGIVSAALNLGGQIVDKE